MVRGRRRLMLGITLLMMASIGSAPQVPALAAGGLRTTTVGPASPRVFRVEFIGASITAGYTAGPSHSYVYGVVAALVRSHGQVVWERAGWAGARVGDAAYMAIMPRADAYVVQLATNDVVGIGPTPLPTFLNQYARLAGRLRSTSPAARIICLGAWANASARNAIGVPVSAYNTAVQRGCAGVDGQFVDLALTYANPANHASKARGTRGQATDTFHPNDRGHAAIAAAVIIAIDRPSRPGGP
ncbi:MAG: acyl-CoA thioesterase [Chloroflexota bacterium]|jgi:lysophospholipase L1-like esterase|nr:acyl-CoA thioesterase [Chloroflexota bacterium]